MQVPAFLEIIGSLGLFLFGMKVMSDGIQKAAGEKLQKILNYMTINRFAAVFTGFFITAVIQSSSATTVMVVSFVNAGLLSLKQSIGVIMGANIGTTVTGWIVAILGFKFKITALALPAIGLGLPLYYSQKGKVRDIGEFSIGFGLLFLGLSFLKGSVPDIKNNPDVLYFLTHFTDLGFLSFLIFIVVGTVLTFIVQSSSAAMAITITMAYAGWIDFPTAAAIVLGENIGTTVTAYLASIKTNTNARRAARGHMVFNILGVVWMAFAFPLFIDLVDLLVPGDGHLAENIPSHLAMFHTLFNITNTLVFIGFVPQIAKLVEKLVPERKDDTSGKYSFAYLAAKTQNTPEINLMKAQIEISKMAGIVADMYTRFLDVFRQPEKKLKSQVEELKEKEEYTDQMQEEISGYLVECSAESLGESGIRHSTSMMRVVNELESIGDSCFNLILLAERRYRKKMVFSDKAIAELRDFSLLVEKFLIFIKEHLDTPFTEDDLREAMELESNIDNTRLKLRKAARKRIQAGSDVKAELLLDDIIKHMEHIGDYSMNIAEALRHM